MAVLHYSDRAVRLAALFQIALVIVLGAPEFRRGLNLGSNRSIEFAAPVHFFLRRFGRGFLFGRMIENHRAILRADVEGKNRSEEHTSELQSLTNLVCRLLLENKKRN